MTAWRWLRVMNHDFFNWEWGSWYWYSLSWFNYMSLSNNQVQTNSRLIKSLSDVIVTLTVFWTWATHSSCKKQSMNCDCCDVVSDWLQAQFYCTIQPPTASLLLDIQHALQSYICGQETIQQIKVQNRHV